MKKTRILSILLALVFGVSVAMGQNSLPAPGSGGSYTPNLGGGGLGPNGIGWNPGPAYPGWGGPWNSGWNYSPTIVVNTPTDQGIERVVACGYDNFGTWHVLPLVVSYQYDGAQYNVTVLNAWDPLTSSWNRGVDMPAYNTSYYLRGVLYDFYVPLTTGTYYFNL